MKDPEYGTMKKKVVFYDSDKRYAELRIRLQHDSLAQSHFFRSIITGYLRQDEDIMNFVDKLNRSKKSVKDDRELIKVGKDTLRTLDLDSSEIESIFDILEQENPDL